MNCRSTHQGPFVQDNIAEFRRKLLEPRRAPQLSTFDRYWPSVFSIVMSLVAFAVIHFYGWVR